MKLVSVVFAAVNVSPADADEFLGASFKRHAQNLGSLQATEEEMQVALNAVLHCGGAKEPAENVERLASIEKSVLPVWRSLPKDGAGRVEWKLLRYLAHRYFMQQFGILVRGLEPTLVANASRAGEIDVLRQHAPELAAQVFGSKRPTEQGFSLKDAAAMISALDHLLFDSERSLLEKAYKDRGFLPQQALTQKQLKSVMTDFMLYWMFGEEEAQEILKDANWEKIAETSIPHWQGVKFMVEGSVVAADHAKRTAPRSGDGQTLFGDSRGFEDALDAAGRIGRGFSSFWNGQCQATKDSLVAMDITGTGRVKLSDFYGANQGGEWRFGESEAYLRELGALDETGSSKQVLIANYMQGASNCVVMRDHYLVCCMNECESVLSEIEQALGSPTAEVERVVSVVENMADEAGDFIVLSEALKTRLQEVAERHGGEVPLHGRLFTQWLHYVFPHECIFPHRAGTAAAVTPGQFGDQYMVTAEEMSRHVEEQMMQNVSHEAVSWMTQWSDEEELLADYVYTQQFSGRRVETRIVAVLVVFALAGLWANFGMQSLPMGTAATEKVHIV